MSERRRQCNDETCDFTEVALPIPIITVTSQHKELSHEQRI
jgi:hypothetical protein